MMSRKLNELIEDMVILQHKHLVATHAHAYTLANILLDRATRLNKKIAELQRQGREK